jgi:hypothetical protein
LKKQKSKWIKKRKKTNHRGHRGIIVFKKNTEKEINKNSALSVVKKFRG